MSVNNDLSKEVRDLNDDSVDSMDHQSDLSLELAALHLEVAKLRVEQERTKLQRIKKNSARRPWLFGGCLLLIAVMYGHLLYALHNDLMTKTDVIVDYFHLAELLILALVATTLSVVLIRAIFSPYNNQDTNLTDNIPTKVISEAFTKSAE